jgi:hypothetical protein
VPAVGLKPSARQGKARLRGLDKDYKPSLSAGKPRRGYGVEPRRGYGVESWVRGRPRPHARRRRAHLEQTLLICAPEVRAPI